MSQEDIEALRPVFEQFARGDFSAYDDLPDELELVVAPEMPDAGSYRGAAGRDWLKGWVATFDRLTVEAVDFLDAGDQVVVEVLQRGWPRDSNAAVELSTWAVMTVREGLAVRMDLFLSRGQALRAAGLGE